MKRRERATERLSKTLVRPDNPEVMLHDPQTNTLQIVTLLTDLRPDWAGTLILSCGLTPAGADLALAANIAGATCLSLDASPENCRSALRTGAVDFAVNTLDEALRALKNEIRKGHPLSVALEGDPSTNLAEILERGVLPELFTAFAPEPPDLRARDACQHAAFIFESQGAVLVNIDGNLGYLPSAINAEARLESFTTEHHLSLQTFAFDSAPALRSFDANVLSILPTADRRRRWASSAPLHFSRARPIHRRSLFLTPGEQDYLARNPPAGALSISPL